jgi:hypothetical protein
MMSLPRKLLAILGCNLATHPIVFFLIPRLVDHFNGRFVDSLVIAEVFAPVVEALLLWKLLRLSAGRATLTSMAANLCSWSVGVYLIK